jgi:hypothetical protein
MMESDLIKGKVARVLNSRELVINRGSEHGVERGMTFEVLDASGSEIRDPDTDEIIGSVYRPKVRVRVLTVEPRLSVARTYRTRQKNVGGTGGLGLGGLLISSGFGGSSSAPPKWVEVPETFKSEEAAWENLEENKSFVKTGDPVRQVTRPPRRSTNDEPAAASEDAS